MGNFLLIIGIVLTVLQAMLKGHIKSVNIAGLIILASTFLIAIGRNLFVKLIALTIPLYFFAKDYGLLGNKKDLWTVIFSSLPLFIMLFGFFIMFRGLFKK
jgi:hypothetical protein